LCGKLFAKSRIIPRIASLGSKHLECHRKTLIEHLWYFLWPEIYIGVRKDKYKDSEVIRLKTVDDLKNI
jgi:hypothetical protein